MDKKIRIITHTDFDGAAFPYFISQLAEVIGLNNAISIEYCDINNVSQIMQRDFQEYEKYSADELQNVYYLVHDIADIGEADKIMPRIATMQTKGLNFSYIDHHKSDNSQKMSHNLECMYYSDDKSMCASMIGYTIILKNLMDINQIEEADRFLNLLQFNNEQKIFLKENFKRLSEEKKIKKLSYQKKFFTGLFNGNPDDINNEEIKKTLKNSFGLIKGADFIDRGKVHEIQGLDLIRDYFNLAIEHSSSDLESILSNIMNVLCSDQADEKWTQINDVTCYLSRKHMPKERVEESVRNAEFINIYGSSGKKYKIAVFFASGDIRYDLEKNRHRMGEVFESLDLEPFNVDAVLTLTRFTIGKTPIMTLRRTSTKIKILDMANDTFKQKNLISGTNAGIPIEYSREAYDELSKCSHNIVRYRKIQHKHLLLKEQNKMKEIIRELLNKHFEIEVIKPQQRKEINDNFDII